MKTDTRKRTCWTLGLPLMNHHAVAVEGGDPVMGVAAEGGEEVVWVAVTGNRARLHQRWMTKQTSLVWSKVRHEQIQSILLITVSPALPVKILTSVVCQDKWISVHWCGYFSTSGLT